MSSPTPSEPLGPTLVHAIDAYFDAWDRSLIAMEQQNYTLARTIQHESKAALITWMSLFAARLDSRTAQLLVDVLKDFQTTLERVSELETAQRSLAARVALLERERRAP
jgi:hypothetical protein